jgi:transposase
MIIPTIAAAVSFGSSAAARPFGVSVASAGRWVTRYKTTQISSSPSGGDRRSGRVEAQLEYLLGLIRRTPDIPPPPSRHVQKKTAHAGTGSPPTRS